MKLVHQAKPDLLLTQEHHMCPGCGEPMALRGYLEVIEELGVARRTIAVHGIGCYTSFSMTTDLDLVQALHGRAPSVATGVKRMQPDAIVFTLQGDGDMVNEGLQEVLHTAARGENVTCILLNNGVFGETGGHMTATTVLGQRTKNSLDGRDADYHGYPILIGDLIARLQGAAYVARGSVHNAAGFARTKRMFKRAFETQIRGEGFSFVEVLTMCPTGWFIPTADGPGYMNETLGEVHIMGELKVDGLVRTTDELHDENLHKAAEIEAALARRSRRLMDFTYPPAAEAFRKEFRAWLDDHLTDEFRGEAGGFSLDLSAERLEELRRWNRLLADARYAAIAWPEEYGGRGAGTMEQVVFAEEMHRARAPGTLNPIGLSNIAPAIIEHGSEEQKRTLLPRMLRGDDIWCQGFSEPDAGSDLASLKTSAVIDGDAFVVNGQKTWNTLGHLANWCELLVRTDPDAPKHRGISCLLVEMTRPGVEVRPLITITGEREFNEVFFTDVRVPRTALLGPLHEGWRVAMTTLAYERGTVANLHLGLRAKIRRLLDEARARGADRDPVLRQKLARIYLEGELLKLVSERAISGAINGRELGPESSIAKLLWSEAEQHLGETAGEVLGPDANRGAWGRDRVYMRALTIAGGTTQVNKNILATRVLGLPRA